jgi:hypothetical protein
MPKVRLILEDDNGVTTEQIYELPTDLANLDGIDEAVEQFRLQTLPLLEKQLLEKVQQTAVQQEKKTLSVAKRDGKADPADPTRSL